MREFDITLCDTVDKAIKMAKEMLIDKADEMGIYENFGQEEIRNIKDKFVDITDFTEDMMKVRNQIDAFEDWCMTYTGK